MMSAVHPSALVDAKAELADGVEVGPFAIVGSDVHLGEGTEVGAGAQIQGPTRIGRRNRIFPYACLGFAPQDLKFRDEKVFLEVGDDNQFREFCTVHRGTEEGGGRTIIGSGNLFMAYSHVAHDCNVGSRTIFANAATLAGHVEVGDYAVVGAFSAVQQFCRVGKYSYIGGFSVITLDTLPFMRVVGHKPVNLGVNRIGLERQGVAPERIRRIEAAMRLLLRSKLPKATALARIRRELGGIQEIEELLAFVESAERGFIKSVLGSRGAGRGASAG